MLASLGGSRSKPELRLVCGLEKEAVGLLTNATEEWDNAQAAYSVMAEADARREPTLGLDFQAIALWHFARAAQYFRKAEIKFLEAGKIQTRKSAKLAESAKSAAARAERAEREGRTLGSRTEVNYGGNSR